MAANAKIAAMDPAPVSHPDRVASTLATVDQQRLARGDASFSSPGPGSRDCRIDLKILAWQAARARKRSPAADRHLAAFDPERRPDLWAGTVRDGTARGFAAALEEAIALAPEPDPPPVVDDAQRVVLTGRKQLRSKKDLLVKSGNSRVRFSRRDGLLYVAGENELNSNNCLRFEARRDLGTLDAFDGDDSVRPRLFSAQFLQPERYETAPGFTRLTLAGRIGRGAVGWNTTVQITGHESETTLLLEITIDNTMTDWRLRARFLGLPSEQIAHECADVREVVANDAGGFVAFTLVRACGRLVIDGDTVPVPGAQCRGQLTHRFRL